MRRIRTALSIGLVLASACGQEDQSTPAEGETVADGASGNSDACAEQPACSPGCPCDNTTTPPTPSQGCSNGNCGSVTPPAGGGGGGDSSQCGDRKIGGYEQCDDGNRQDGDGCSSDCTPEFAHACSGEPSSCSASSLPGDTRMDSLTQSQAVTWCTWMLNVLRAPNITVYCGSAQDFYNTRSVEECAAFYANGLKSGEAWWCAHSKGHIQGENYVHLCAPAQAGGKSPLAGCTVKQAEDQIIEIYSAGEMRNDKLTSLNFPGPCALFEATPSCAGGS